MIGTEALRSFLAKTPFFGGLTEPQLEQVVAMLKERELDSAAVVFRQGDAGRSMFVIGRGEVLMTAKKPSGGEIRLVRLGVGDFFGEITLIEMAPRTCTANCAGPTTLFELTGMDLYRLYRHDVHAYVMILQNINRELCRRLRSADERITAYADEFEEEGTQVSNPRSASGLPPLPR